MVKSVDIKLRTTADTAGADETAEAIDNVGNEAEETGQQGSEAGLALESKLALAAAAAAGLAAAIATARRALMDFAADQEAVAELDAVLANTGELTDSYREKLQSLAGELQNTTAVSNTEWLKALKTQIQIGSANEETIDDQITAVKNLAGILGGDVQQASMLFARAVAGQAEMLQRYGIMIDKAADGTVNLDKLMQDLARMGGGVLEARADTLAGGFDTLDNKFSDLLKAMAQASTQSGILGDAVRGLGDAFDFWTDKIGKPIEQLDSVNNKVQASKLSADEAEAANRRYAEAMAAVGENAANAATAIDEEVAAVKRRVRAESELEGILEQIEIAKVNASDLPEIQRLEAIAKIKARFREEEVKRLQEANAEGVALRKKQAEEAARLEEELLSKIQQAQEKNQELQSAAGDEIALANQISFREKGQRELIKDFERKKQIWDEELKYNKRLTESRKQREEASLAAFKKGIEQNAEFIADLKERLQTLPAANKALQENTIALGKYQEALALAQTKAAAANEQFKKTKAVLTAENEQLSKKLSLTQQLANIQTANKLQTAEEKAAAAQNAANQKTAGGLANQAGTVTSGIDSPLIEPIKSAAEAVKKDGATSTELNSLGTVLDTLARAIESRDVDQANKISTLVQRIDELAARIQNNDS